MRVCMWRNAVGFHRTTRHSRESHAIGCLGMWDIAYIYIFIDVYIFISVCFGSCMCIIFSCVYFIYSLYLVCCCFCCIFYKSEFTISVKTYIYRYIPIYILLYRAIRSGGSVCVFVHLYFSVSGMRSFGVIENKIYNKTKKINISRKHKTGTRKSLHMLHT